MRNLALVLATLTVFTFATRARGQEDADDEPTVTVGEGRIQLGGLFQLWLFDELGEEVQGGDSEITSTFRVRRAELRLKGVLIEDLVEMGLMIDPAKQLFGRERSSGREALIDEDGDGVADDTTLVPRYRSDDTILQDLYLSFFPVPQLRLKAGQFKRPLGFEGPYSSSRLVFDERAQVSRALSGDGRDLGVMATVSLERAHLTVDLGVFNGTPTGARSGVNEDDENPWKDVVLRVGVEPVPGLEMGVSGLYGIEGPVQHGPDPGSSTDVRYGAWVRFSNDRLDVRAEALFQRLEFEGDPAAGIPDSDIPSGGFYLLAEYRLVPKLGVGARLDWFNSNSEIGGDRSIDTNVTGGVSYYIDDHHAKLQVAYTGSLEGDLSTDPTAVESGAEADDTLTFVAQVAF